MGMHVGGKGPQADINVTPLIDIVLVLLIIFMVLTPMMQRGYDMSIPEKADSADPLPTATDQLVLQIERDGRILINKDPVSEESVRTKLEDLLRGRREKTIFFQCDDNVVYSKAIAVMDSVRAAGGTVGLVTTEIRHGQ